MSVVTTFKHIWLSQHQKEIAFEKKVHLFSKLEWTESTDSSQLAMFHPKRVYITQLWLYQTINKLTVIKSTKSSAAQTEQLHCLCVLFYLAILELGSISVLERAVFKPDFKEFNFSSPRYKMKVCVKRMKNTVNQKHFIKT